MLLNSLFKHWSFRIVAPGILLREKYDALKSLLRHDGKCHEQMADFQDLLHSDKIEDYAGIRQRFSSFSDEVAAMLDSLEILAPGKFLALKSYHRKFDFYVRFLLAPPKLDTAPPYILSFDDIDRHNTNVGNKAKHLALLHKHDNILTPRGFVLTTNAFHYFIEFNDLRQSIDDLLSTLDIYSYSSLQKTATQLQKCIQTAEVPPAVEKAMLEAYDHLVESDQHSISVAVRSSALAEDDESSFAGQYLSLMDIDRAGLAQAYRQILASKYSAEALFYRISKGFGDEQTAMSVLIQEMVTASCSGVLYTGDAGHNSESPDDLHLQVIAGHGGQLVGGTATPVSYIVPREEILGSSIAPRSTSSELVDISSAEISQIARLGVQIEKFFQHPQDIEWAIDEQRKLFILQARTLSAPHRQSKPTTPKQDDITNEILIEDCSRASGGVASGPVHLLGDNNHLDDIPRGAVVVTQDTPPQYVTFLPQAAAVLAEHGSRASHFATIAREFEIPFLTGINQVTSIFSADQTITVDGDNGRVYQGRIATLLEDQQETSTRRQHRYYRLLSEVFKFITPLELIDPTGENFTPEGCRSMHDIIRFTHEKALQAMFSAGRPGTGIGSVRLAADIPLDVFLFDVGGGIGQHAQDQKRVDLDAIDSIPFKALWQGLSHPDVQWRQKPFDWDAFDKIELSGGVAPAKDSFAFASYAVIGEDYLHFNIRFGYHFTIIDVLCSEHTAENHCMLRFAGGGGDFDHRSLRIDFLVQVLERLEFEVERKGDLLEARLFGRTRQTLTEKLDLLGRLFGATKLMDMVLENNQMVDQCVEDFFAGRYSFSQEG